MQDAAARISGDDEVRRDVMGSHGLRVCVLASGSRGNCTYVGGGATHLLVDAGLSGRQTALRLERLGVKLADVGAVCLSHEHDDHKSALPLLQRRYGMALYANAGTIEAVQRGSRHRGLAWQVFTNGSPFTVGELTIEPFSVPHDSYDPVGFAITRGPTRIAVVTDMGIPTELIRQRLRRCRAIVLEANHDEVMLREAARPWMLKQRIAGRQGHLSNAQAAQLLTDIAGPDLQAVVLAHLSEQCNAPARALEEVRAALAGAGYAHVTVSVARPDGAGEVLDL